MFYSFYQYYKSNIINILSPIDYYNFIDKHFLHWHFPFLSQHIAKYIIKNFDIIFNNSMESQQRSNLKSKIYFI